jgi:hypothetical protein
MAQVPLSSGTICRPYRTPWGAFHLEHYTPISTSPAIFAGQPVTLDYTANSTNAGQIKGSSAAAFQYLVGISGASIAAGSSAVATNPIPVYSANPSQEFVAYSIGGVVTSSIVGLRKKLHWDSTLSIAVVDVGASTAADWRVIVTGVPGVNGRTGLVGELGDSGAQVTFRFISALAENTNSTVPSSTPLLAFFG